MTARIDVTQAQAAALARLTAEEGQVSLHQLVGPEHTPGDIYATPHGSVHGFRIAVDGTISRIGETLPAG